MITAQDTMQKLTGNFPDELSQAGYRIVADNLVDLIQKRLLHSLTQNASQVGNEFANKVSAFIRTEAGEAAISFVLAIVLEMAPMGIADELRRNLAYNLRIQAYEEAGELLLTMIGFLNADLNQALQKASHLPEAQGANS